MTDFAADDAGWQDKSYAQRRAEILRQFQSLYTPEDLAAAYQVIHQQALAGDPKAQRLYLQYAPYFPCQG